MGLFFLLLMKIVFGSLVLMDGVGNIREFPDGLDNFFEFHDKTISFGFAGPDGDPGPIGRDVTNEKYYESLSFVDRPPFGYFYEPRTIMIPWNISWIVKFKTKKFCKSTEDSYYTLCEIQDVRGFDTEKKAEEFYRLKNGISLIKI